MRVISGLKKGHKLKSPKGLDVRPTEDRIKESLFNIIGQIHSNCIVLDLFAGSGSIGIEFLSRGAEKCYFVDISSSSLSVVEDNLNHTGLHKNGILIKKDAKIALKDFENHNIKFDYIYLDPPFRHETLLISVIEKICNSKILVESGIVIVEHEKELVLDMELYGLIKYKDRNYGSKTLDFYKNI